MMPYRPSREELDRREREDEAKLAERSAIAVPYWQEIAAACEARAFLLDDV